MSSATPSIFSTFLHAHITKYSPDSIKDRAVSLPNPDVVPVTTHNFLPLGTLIFDDELPIDPNIISRLLAP